MEDTRGGTVAGSAPGIISSNGANWMQQRRHSLHTLRDLGLGKHTMEEIVTEEAAELCKALEETDAQPIDIRAEFNVSVLNALWFILSSEKLSRTDPKLKRVLKLLDDMFQQTTSLISRLILIYKPLRMLNDRFKVYANTHAFDGMRNLGEITLKHHEATFQEDSMRDFIDHYLKKMRDEEESVYFKGKEGRLNILNIIVDFFIAGSETTSTTLNWGMFYMVLNQDVQRKVQEELDSVTGGSRLPTWADRTSTPYTEAVIHEIQRLGNILTLSVSHFSNADGTLDNGRYFVPKGTAIFCSLGDVMSNPEYFPEPDKFDPTRFLNGGKFEPHPKVIPFGLGKRRCLGETLARMELYIFFTAILSRFSLTKARDSDVYDHEPIMGTTMSPKPYKMKFIPRK